MEDKISKDSSYYSEHKEEAQNKVKWCLDKASLDEKEVEKVVNDVVEHGSIFGVESYLDLVGNIGRGSDSINIMNCKEALSVYLDDEVDKVKKAKK